MRAGADVEALRRIEPVTLNDDDAESGEGLAAPADGWAGPMRAVVHVQVDPEQLARAIEGRGDVLIASLFRR